MSNWYLIVLVIIAAAGIFFLLRSRNAGAARREVERRAESRPAAGPRRGSRRRSARQYERRGTSLGDGELTAESGDSGAARHADRVTPVTPQHGSAFFNRPGRCRYGTRGRAAPLLEDSASLPFVLRCQGEGSPDGAIFLSNGSDVDA